MTGREKTLLFWPLDTVELLLTPSGVWGTSSSLTMLLCAVLRQPLSASHSLCLLPRKEVIQAHLPVHLPCYDFVPVTSPTFDGSFLSVRIPASGVASSHDVTGGVYKARERIHRSLLICDY